MSEGGGWSCWSTYLVILDEDVIDILSLDDVVNLWWQIEEVALGDRNVVRADELQLRRIATEVTGLMMFNTSAFNNHQHPTINIQQQQQQQQHHKILNEPLGHGDLIRIEETED